MLKKLASETAIYGMSHVLPRILNYIVLTVYLTYKFDDTRDFGIYSDLYAYATIILTLMVFRMDTAYFRYGSRDSNLNKVFSTAFIPLAIATLLMVILMYRNAESIANFLKYPGKQYYVKWFAGILSFDAICALVYARFRLESRPMRFLFYRVANVLLTIVFILIFLEVTPQISPVFHLKIGRLLGVNSQLDWVFFSNLLASFSVFILMLSEFRKVKFEFDRSLYIQMLKYSIPLVIVGIAGNINQAMAVPLQKYLLRGDTDLNLSMAGIYSAGAKLAILLNLFTTAYNYAAEPFFFNTAAKNEKSDVYGDMAYAFTLFTGLAALFTYFYIDVLILLIGPEYRSGVVVVPILLVSYIFLGIYYNFSIWYKLADKTHIGGLISIAAVVVTLLFSFLLLPTIGIVGSAITSLLCYGFMAVAGYLTGQKYYPISYPVKAMVRIIVIVVAFITLSWLVRNYIPQPLHMQVAMQSLLALLALFTVYKYEFSSVASLLRKK